MFSCLLRLLARVLQYTVGNKWHMTSCNMHEMHMTSWWLGMTLLPAMSTCYFLLVFASFWLMCSESGNDYMTDLARVHVARRQWRNTELWDFPTGCPESNGDDMTTWVSAAPITSIWIWQWKKNTTCSNDGWGGPGDNRFINLVGRWHFRGKRPFFRREVFMLVSGRVMDKT